MGRATAQILHAHGASVAVLEKFGCASISAMVPEHLPSELPAADAKPTCDAGCDVTLSRERPSGSSCDSLAADGGGKYHYQRTFDVS